MSTPIREARLRELFEQHSLRVPAYAYRHIGVGRRAMLAALADLRRAPTWSADERAAVSTTVLATDPHRLDHVAAASPGDHLGPHQPASARRGAPENVLAGQPASDSR